MKNKIISNISLLLLLIIYSSWFLTTHPNLGPDLSSNFLPLNNGIPQPWIWANTLTGDGMGIDTSLTLWTFPAQAIYQLFLKLGIPFLLQMKYLAVLPMIFISAVGMKMLSKIYNFDWKMGSLFYLSNTYILTVIDGGQLNLAIAYSLIPIAFYFYLKSLESFKYIFALTSILWIMTSFDLRVTIISCLISGLYGIFNFKQFLKSIGVLILSGIIILLLNFFWLIPALNSSDTTFEKNYGTSSQVQQFSFSSIRHAIFIQQPHWYLNDFGKVNTPDFIYSVIPILAFMGFIIKRDKQTMFIFLIGIIGIFLSKGTQPPFGEIYIKIFEISPLLKGFRDPSKFYMLTAISYSILIGVLINQLKKMVFLKTFSSLVIFIIFALAYPTYTGLMTGTFSKVPDKYLYKDLNEVISNSTDFFRTFWIPTKTPNGYASVYHPSTEAQWTIPKRPFTTNIVGNYELFNFLRAPAAPQLLGLTSVKYLIYPEPDTRKGSFNQDDINYYEWFINWFKNQEWLTSRPELGSGVFEINDFKPRFYSINNIIWVIGSDDTYNYLASNNRDFTKMGIVHLDANPKLVDRVGTFTGISELLVFNKTTDIDHLMLGVDRSKIINLSNYVFRTGDDPSGWWSRGSSEYLEFKAILNEKYSLTLNDFDRGVGYIISEGENTVSFDLKDKLDNVDKELYARVLFSTSSGKLRFKSDKDEYVVNTLSEDNVIRWIKVGKFRSINNLSISSEGNLNIVNTISLLDSKEILNLQNKLASIPDHVKKMDLSNLKEINDLEYKKINSTFINPTEHKILVDTAPSIVVFTDNYNKNWKIVDESSSFQVFDMLNAFYVDTSGEHRVLYSKQPSIYPGLIIMYISLPLIIVIMIILFKLKKNK